MSRPKTYRNQDGCHNCRHTYDRENHDFYDAFCDIDDDRPIDHLDVGDDDPNRQEILDAFTDWATPDRSVDVEGICDQWEKTD